MKAFVESFSTLFYIAFFLGLTFLFKGDPSLWDQLHIAAMSKVTTAGTDANGRFRAQGGCTNDNGGDSRPTPTPKEK